MELMLLLFLWATACPIVGVPLAISRGRRNLGSPNAPGIACMNLVVLSTLVPLTLLIPSLLLAWPVLVANAVWWWVARHNNRRHRALSEGDRIEAILASVRTHVPTPDTRRDHVRLD